MNLRLTTSSKHIYYQPFEMVLSSRFSNNMSKYIPTTVYCLTWVYLQIREASCVVSFRNPLKKQSVLRPTDRPTDLSLDNVIHKTPSTRRVCAARGQRHRAEHKLNVHLEKMMDITVRLHSPSFSLGCCFNAVLQSSSSTQRLFFEGSTRPTQMLSGVLRLKLPQRRPLT